MTPAADLKSPPPNLLAGERFPNATTRRRRQSRSQLRRDRIRKAALRLFLDFGYEQASIAAIAQSADVAAGALYQDVASKRQLLLVLMQEFLTRIAAVEPAAIPQPPTPADFERLINQSLAAGAVTLGAYRAWREAICGDGELAEADRRIREWSAGRFEEMIRTSIAASETRSGLNPATLASLLDAAVWNLFAVAADPGSRADLNELSAALARLIWHALFPDPAAGNFVGATHTPGTVK